MSDRDYLGFLTKLAAQDYMADSEYATLVYLERQARHLYERLDDTVADALCDNTSYSKLLRLRDRALRRKQRRTINRMRRKSALSIVSK